jgi:hypothetical protein
MNLFQALFNVSLAAVGCGSSSSGSSPVIKDCAGEAGLFSVTKAALEPANPAPGTQVALTLEYTVPDLIRIVTGTSTYESTFNFIPLPATVHPLCQDVACPIGSGAHSNTTTSAWPSGVKGAYTSKMTWRGTNWRTLRTDREDDVSWVSGEAEEVGGTDEAVLLCIQISGTLADSCDAAAAAATTNLRGGR